MLYRMDKLIGLSIGASDGELGNIKDVYFDDHRWAVRYLVVETGDWLKGRKVLISPIAVESIDWNQQVVHVRLTQQQVKGSPDIDTAKPVSRQHELSFLDYYGYPDYWSGSLLWGATPYPVAPQPVVTRKPPGSVKHSHLDPHLRSLKEVLGYHLQATDAPIGHLEDFLIDNGSWAMRYVVVDTANWWLGMHVVIPPQWIQQLNWETKNVYVDVSRTTIKRAPEYDPDIELVREYEAALFGHYERPGYWH